MDAEPRLWVLYRGAERAGWKTVLGENRRKQCVVTLDRGALCSQKRPGARTGTRTGTLNYRDSVEGVRADLEGLPRTSYGYISVRANAPVSIETLRESA